MAKIGHNQPNFENINKLAREQYDLQEQIAGVEVELEQLNTRLLQLSEKILPDALEALELADYSTSDGLKVKLNSTIKGALVVANRPAGHEWLEQSGFGALIDREVVAEFNRDEDEAASELIAELAKKGRTAQYKKSVHAGRLDAFIRRRLEEGEKVPQDIFTVYTLRETKVTKKNERKNKNE
jgi:hypothetical protein